MGNKLKERIYKCSCGEERKEYVWDGDLSKTVFKCFKCENTLKQSNILVPEKKQYTSVHTETKIR